MRTDRKTRTTSCRGYVCCFKVLRSVSIVVTAIKLLECLIEFRRDVNGGLLSCLTMLLARATMPSGNSQFLDLVKVLMRGRGYFLDNCVRSLSGSIVGSYEEGASNEVFEWDTPGNPWGCRCVGRGWYCVQ